MYFNHRISSTYRSLIAILREKLIVLHFISISYVYMFYMYFFNLLVWYDFFVSENNNVQCTVIDIDIDILLRVYT